MRIVYVSDLVLRGAEERKREILINALLYTLKYFITNFLIIK